MTNVPDHRSTRSRRRILVAAALALGALFVVGAAVQVPRLQADLSRRVEQRLADDGVVVDAAFSGQDGSLRCPAPLADPASAVAAAESVWGVRTIEIDASCGVTGGADAPTTLPTTVPTSTAATTTAPVTATTVATTTTTLGATTTVAPSSTAIAQPVLFNAQLIDGRLVLTGTMSTDLERLALVQGAAAAVDAGNVDDRLTVGPPSVLVPSEQFDGLLALLALMPVNLVAGDLGWNGSSVLVSGSYADDAMRATFTTAAAEVGIAADLVPRPTATPEQAAALEAELNALVAAEPILFDKGSTTIGAVSVATVQRVAGIAKRYAGVAIEVQGHTDSEGDPARNLTLSEQRAAAVLDALVARGVPTADLSAKGFGMTELIRDADGNELPEKSRRVVFGVTAL